MQQHHRTALLIIDMQSGMYDGPEPPYEGERVLANINALIGRARDAGSTYSLYAMRGQKGHRSQQAAIFGNCIRAWQ